MNLEDIELGKNFIAQIDYSSAKRQELADKGQAMPHGGYPITNIAGLKRAIQAFGRAKDKAKTKAWIIRRARALGAIDLLPDGWVTVKQSNVLDFVKHHGVKGMHWGVRKSQSASPTARTKFSKSPKKLTNDELKRRIARMETEKRYNELNRRDISAGEKLASEILTNVGRTAVTTVATGAALYGVKLALNAKFGSGSPRSVARTNVGLKPLADIGSIVTKRGK
jgi:hypothetical protein